ncbi:MAG: hypothetical protein ACK5D5_11565 [Bacteroidota bacterium]|jgi:hypothetical protein
MLSQSLLRLCDFSQEMNAGLKLKSLDGNLIFKNIFWDKFKYWATEFDYFELLIKDNYVFNSFDKNPCSFNVVFLGIGNFDDTILIKTYLRLKNGDIFCELNFLFQLDVVTTLKRIFDDIFGLLNIDLSSDLRFRTIVLPEKINISVFSNIDDIPHSVEC